MGGDLEFLQNHSLTSVLRREIEALILSGAFGPGERLNENLLAARFAVSRGPVREACRALVEKGLLELVPNRGVYVRRIDDRQAAELYDLRAGLFATAARLLAATIKDAELDELDALLLGMEAAAARQSLEDYYPLNLAFHERILSFAGNASLLAAYREAIKALHLFRERGLLHGGGLSVSNSEHRAILEALRGHRPLAAMEAAFLHVQNGKARMILPGREDGQTGAA